MVLIVIVQSLISEIHSIATASKITRLWLRTETINYLSKVHTY